MGETKKGRKPSKDKTSSQISQWMILTRSHKGVLESVAEPCHCLVWERRAEIFIFPHPQVIGSGQLPGESNCSSNSHTPYLSSASLREALWKRDTSASYWGWKHTKSLWTWNGKDVQGATGRAMTSSVTDAEWAKLHSPPGNQNIQG